MREPENLKELIDYLEWSYKRMKDDQNVVCSLSDGDSFHELLLDLKNKYSYCTISDKVPEGSLCEICNKKIDDLNGNPDLWGIALPYKNGNGKIKYYHRGCAANMIDILVSNNFVRELEQEEK